MKKDEVKITVSGNELNSEILVGEEKCLVQTEKGGPKNLLVVTKIYLKGKIISTIKIDYREITDVLNVEDRMFELMQKQHQLAIGILKKEETKKIKPQEEYLDEVKGLLRKNPKNAFELLNKALEHYSNDPFILSYYGCLDAIINKNYRSGIDTCNSAIKMFREKVPFGEEFFYPVFYLNLGRAYVAAGRRKDAIESFKKGLKMDKDDSDILMELKKLGERKKPPVQFLRRSHPINKYIGMILHKLGE